MPQPVGTTTTVAVVRAVDGDTLKIQAPGLPDDGIENVRLLALDTEESNPGGTKPVTPFGKVTKLRMEALFAAGDEIVVEFPGNEPVAECWERYRDNYRRPLVFVHKDGVDAQELLIREGYSPYFVKYGRAPFADHDRAYAEAERAAQAAGAGLWDQLAVNGSEMRNYAALGVWWQLRAQIVDDFRRITPRPADLFDSRLDYAALVELARNGGTATVFTELRSTRQLAAGHVVVDIGSQQQPFSVFIPEADRDPNAAIVRLLVERYIGGGETHPGRSYAYVRGPLSLFGNRPDLPPIVQVRAASPDQVTDRPPS
jgi:micrococcal nuclease